MRGTDYDVVIVGARCAGATLATYLARSGASVLMLDKDPLPSDQVVSTHSINPPAMEVLDELGLGSAVRDVTPPSRVFRMSIDEMWFDVSVGYGTALYCPRRGRLDGLLQKVAVAAGALLADRTKLLSLVKQGDRVQGVRVSHDGRERTITAELVVGADGRHSTVARLAEAEEYLGYDAPRASYWAYWDAPGFWKSDAAYCFDMYFSVAGGLPRVIFQTDENQLLIASCPPAGATGPWRADPCGVLRRVLSADPVIEPIVRNSLPNGKVRATVKERYFSAGARGAAGF